MTFTFERTPIKKEPLSFLIPVGSDHKVDGMGRELAKQLGTQQHEIIAVRYGGATDVGQDQNVKVGGADAPGYGGALRAGIQEAQYPLIFVWPAAWRACVPPLGQFLERIDQVDVVAGLRPGRTWGTRFAEGWKEWLAFGMNVQDVRCPVRLYRKTILERIPIQSEGDFADVEVLAKVNYLNALMDEVELPTSVTVAKDGSWSGDFRRVLRKPAWHGAPTGM